MTQFVPDPPTTSFIANRCVHGGKHGDFNWPFNVPDSAFGPWSPRCKSEILDPELPCKPYVPSEPCNFKELAFLFSQVLHAVVTLCHDIPPVGSQGDYDWVDPRLVVIDQWLEFKWFNSFKSCSAELKEGIEHYLFVILKEATMRQNYVYFTGYPELAATLKAIFDSFDGCSWLIFDERIKKVANLILTYGTNKEVLNFQLGIHITSGLDMSWVEDNNKVLTSLRNHSLITAENICRLNLSLIETLRMYSMEAGVLRFEIIANECKGEYKFNLKYGTQKYNVRNSKDFLNVAKMVFGT